MSRRQKESLYRIIAATVLFIGVVLFPSDGVWKTALFLVPYLIVGYDVLWGAVRNILHGRIFDEKFLMALATVGAFIIGEYPEAVFVMLFYQIGELFQAVAVGKSRKSITALMDIAPEEATVFREGEFVSVFPEEVEIGDKILVKPGERIPVDGIVIRGESDIDTSAMTGESVPSFAKVGDKVISGCVNLSSPIELEAIKEYGESTVAKVLELVEHSAMNKGRYESFITRFARIYTPVVVILALLVAFVPPIFWGNFQQWVMRALSFLVVSCPCALVISVPLSFFCGIGAASRRGVLIKGSSYLEILEKCNVVVTDKTGTLTEGRLFVKEVTGNRREAVKLAASLEKYSNHPIGKAIVNEAKELYAAENIVEIPGKGIKGVIGGKLVLAGNNQLLEESGIHVPEFDGGSVVHASCDGVYIGSIIVSDKVKDNAGAVVERLSEMGIRDVIMLTGDSKQSAETICREAGITRMYHSLLPGDKVARLEEIMAESTGGVVYLGDGINDAPVLKRADVGIAMGELGSDAAIESSDIVFMKDDISLLPESIKIARKTMKIVRENIIFSITIKVLVLILTAAGYADMWQAVFADVGVMVIAVLNTLRVLRL